MSQGVRRRIPILVVADDDWEALGRMLEMLSSFHVVSVRSWPKLRESVEEFEPELVLMADTLKYPRMSAETMVERLYSDRQARVLVLTEFLTPEKAAGWRERGAVDCLLHPTKVHGRMSALLGRISELAVLQRGEK